MAFNIDELTKTETFILDGVEYTKPALSARKADQFQKDLGKLNKLPDDAPEKVYAGAAILAKLLGVAEDTFYDTDLVKIQAALKYIFEGEQKKT